MNDFLRLFEMIVFVVSGTIILVAVLKLLVRGFLDNRH